MLLSLALERTHNIPHLLFLQTCSAISFPVSVLMLNLRLVLLPGWSVLSKIIIYKPLYSVFILFALSQLLLFLSLIPPQPHSLSTTLLSSTTPNPGYVSDTLALFWSLLIVVFIIVAFPSPLWFPDSLFLSQLYFCNSLHATSWLTGSFPYFQSEKVLLTLMF